ncbi:MAG TPA: CopG family transcriptional regulator [Chthoniobacterales bacterium]
MRTTLTLDDDVLESARALAAQRGVPIGTVISDLARRGLALVPFGKVRNGIRLFSMYSDADSLTPEIVKALAEEVD